MSTLPTQQVSAVLLDVEGTTTPIDFVYKVLFPYALSHAEEFLKQHASDPDVRADLQAFRREHAADVSKGMDPPQYSEDTPENDIESAVGYMNWLTARDSKLTAFKVLQGKIWREGYASGQLRAQLFDDVPHGLQRWHKQGKIICIFSGGSVLAQKLLFANTDAGDLTAHISGYFDTSVGAKTDPNSYKKIAGAMGKNPSEILFISDVTAELDAAAAAGFQPRLSVRPGNRPQPPGDHRVIHSFDEVLP